MTPIESDEAERATVGALLVAGPQGRAEILAIVEDADFVDSRLRFVVGVVREMVARGVPVDEVTVVGYVSTRALAGPGAPRTHLASELAELVALTPVPASGTWYAAVVVEVSVRRGIRASAERIGRVAEAAAFDELRRILTDELTAGLDSLGRAEAAV